MDRFFDLNDAELKSAYVEEAFVADVQFDICKTMKEKGVSRAELARRLDVSAPYVTQMLGNEDANLTLRTVARVYAALGEEASISARRKKETPADHADRGRVVDNNEWAALQVANDAWTIDPELNKDRVVGEKRSPCAVVWLDALRKAA